MSKAENDIKCCIDALNVNIQYEKQEELFVLSKNHQQLIENQYELISKKYMGHITELVSQIKDLKQELETKELKHQLELQILKSENDLLKKDVLILQLQQQIKQ